jgi:phosphate starvation-inducible PhoH-like protein
MEKISKELIIPENILTEVLGERDAKIRTLANVLSIDIKIKGNKCFLEAAQTDNLENFLSVMQIIVERTSQGDLFSESDYRSLAKKFLQNKSTSTNDWYYQLYKTYKSKLIFCKTMGQYQYVKAMENNRLVICTGPAGTGKTFLAIVQAVRLLKEGKVERIILSKPALEAGESLGYLPGTYQEKLDPYFKPLYDALYYLLGPETVDKLILRGEIEIVPLAYMRGRTLNSAFIILDEGQNTTFPQMKMFLTRIGTDSRTVITGDLTQIDLTSSSGSGLKFLPAILQEVPDVDFVTLKNEDVIQLPLLLLHFFSFSSTPKSFFASFSFT